MSDSTVTNDPVAPSRDHLERRLRAPLDRAERQLLELESVLTDADTIQEDRDSTRLVVESIRDDALQIRRALTRLEQGTYGRCVTCGAEIAPARLELLPFVAHCTRCA